MDIDELNRRIIDIWGKVDLNKFKDYKNIADASGKNKPIDLPLLSPGVITSDINIAPGGFLIIGLNPSYSTSGWIEIMSTINKDNLIRSDSKELVDCAASIKSEKKLEKKRKEEKLNEFSKKIDEYFTYSGILGEDWIKDVCQFESNSFKTHPYFRKMRELAQYVFYPSPANWSHMDILFYRKTSQSELKKLIKNMDDYLKNDEIKEESKEKISVLKSNFFNLQVKISKEIITNLRPKIILISNAFAGEIFRKLFLPATMIRSKGKLQEMEEISRQYLEINRTEKQAREILLGKEIKLTRTQSNDLHELHFANLFYNKKGDGAYSIPILSECNETSVFFSGMLSGQRALDLGSYERLKWHIKAVKEGKKMK